MENYHIIIAKYIKATDKTPSRIRLVSGRYKDSIVIPYQSSSKPNDAISHIQSLGFEVIGKGWNEANGDDYIISSTFKPLKP